MVATMAWRGKGGGEVPAVPGGFVAIEFVGLEEVVSLADEHDGQQ